MGGGMTSQHVTYENTFYHFENEAKDLGRALNMMLSLCYGKHDINTVKDTYEANYLLSCK